MHSVFIRTVCWPLLLTKSSRYIQVSAKSVLPKTKGRKLSAWTGAPWLSVEANNRWATLEGANYNLEKHEPFTWLIWKLHSVRNLQEFKHIEKCLDLSDDGLQQYGRGVPAASTLKCMIGWQLLGQFLLTTEGPKWYHYPSACSMAIKTWTRFTRRNVIDIIEIRFNISQFPDCFRPRTCAMQLLSCLGEVCWFHATLLLKIINLASMATLSDHKCFFLGGLGFEIHHKWFMFKAVH